ncbi:hypothetical protein D3C77_552650 [compost metagenome]
MPVPSTAAVFIPYLIDSKCASWSIPAARPLIVVTFVSLSAETRVLVRNAPSSVESLVPTMAMEYSYRQ